MVDETTIQQMTERYQRAAHARTGDQVECPACGTLHEKTRYNKLFCAAPIRGSSCKDNYWNTVDDTRRKRMEIVRSQLADLTVVARQSEQVQRIVSLMSAAPDQLLDQIQSLLETHHANDNQ